MLVQVDRLTDLAGAKAGRQSPPLISIWRNLAPQMASLHRFWEHAVSSGWQTEEIATGHDMMLQDPHRTVNLLMQISERCEL